MNPWHAAVLVALAWCLASLAWQYRKAKAFGPRKLFAKPAGDPAAGVRYAFIQGMAPGAKESVTRHLPTYAAGLLYHGGIAAGFALLAFRLASLGLPSTLLRGLAVLALAGGIAGLALLAKRIFSPRLRGLSCPDDYLSNLLASAFALLGGLAALLPTAAPAWMHASLLLLVYAPLGKIRHCVFFFPTRYHFGAFFGRRGTYPVRDRA